MTSSSSSPSSSPLPGDRPEGTDWSLLEVALRLSPDAALAVDESGRIRAVNDLVVELFGYGPGELVGASIEELLPERFRSPHAGHRRDYGRHPRHRRMGAGLDLWGRRKDGTDFPVDVSLAPVTGPAGPVVIAAVRDMTERRREQAAQAQLAAIVESTDDAVVATDQDGTITSWNPGAARLLGYERDEIVGRPLAVLVPEHLRAVLAEQRRHVLSGGYVARFETLRRRRDGTDVDVEATLSAVRDAGGQVIGVAGIFREISDRVRARNEAARAERQREQLALLADRERIARDLHDLVIQRLFAAGITLHAAAQRVRDRADIAERIGGVVDELDVTIGEIRSTIFELEQHLAPTGSFRGRVLDLAGEMSGALGHDPVVRFDGPVDAAVTPEVADHALAVVREALTNVARHARAATSRVAVTADDRLTVRVTDNGVGVGTPSRRSGLRNMAQRAAGLGGRFDIATSPGGGTELLWQVPLHPGDPPTSSR